MGDAVAMNPGIEPIGFLVGHWVGRGHGTYPTIDPFDYEEDVVLWQVGKPFVGYRQRTKLLATGMPAHAEDGFWRVVPPTADDATDETVGIEATIAHPTGLTEVLVGTLTGQGIPRIEVATIAVARTPTAKEVTAVERTIEVDGDELTYEVRMAAVGQPLQFHLRGEMRRVS